MPIIRTARPGEIGQLVALADRTFRKPGQSSMGTAYANLFAHENADNLLVMEEDGLPVTLVGLLQASLSIMGCSIPVVSMGAVCTEPAYRGNNYADMLVKRSIAKCTEEGAYLLLISGTRGLYARNDCLEVGQVKRFTVRSSEELKGLAPSDHAVIRPYDETNSDSFILKQMEREKAYYKRTEVELNQLIRCAAFLSNSNTGQHVRLAFSSGGEADGYIVFGIVKGDIPAAEVVEYGGSDEAIANLLNDIIIRFNPQELRFPVMGDRAELSEKLAAAGCSFNEFPIPGTIRILNFVGLWKSLRPYMERQIGAGKLAKLSLIETVNGYRIIYKDDVWTVGHRGATALVFNGPPLMEPSDLKEILTQVFPLPFPYTQNLNFV